MQKLIVKNMVCDRCKIVVTQELEKLGLTPSVVHLGEVELVKSITNDEYQKIKSAFQSVGFELIDDKRSQWIEKIKKLIIQLVNENREKKSIKVNYSEYISRELGRDYSSLSSLFSAVEGVTIEQFIILQKIERVKELLVYDELSLSQIASTLGYSSTAHLSNQFKKVTGLTPSYFKAVGKTKRKSIDKIY